MPMPAASVVVVTETLVVWDPRGAVPRIRRPLELWRASHLKGNMQ